MKKIKLIIFDWDDVFTLGSKEGYFACYHQAINDVGVTLTQEEEHKRILAKWSQPHREELRELLKEHPSLLDKACKIYEKNLLGTTFTDYLSLVPHSIELLNTLHKKYILTIATGLHPTIMKEKVIPRFNIPDIFSTILSTYDLEDPSQHKPSPYMAQKILSSYNLQANEAVLVGDAKNDVLMAQGAGITPIVVLTGHLSEQEARNLNVKHIIKDVTHLPTILTKL